MAAALTSTLLLTPHALGGQAPAAGIALAREEGPGYTFAAAPDLLNQDVGDVRGQRGWDRGDPNSWTPTLAHSVDVVLDEIAAQDPAALLIPGDLVEGHWAMDRLETGIFGPSQTARQRLARLRRAGTFYHAQNVARFAAHGLTVHAAVGDHELGDDPWNRAGGAHADDVRFKRHHVAEYRELFADAYTRTPAGEPRYPDRPVGSQWQDTAYAVQLSPDVLLVTLDEFHSTRDRVHLEVVGEQLDWLRRTLAAAQAADIPWVVVQGHLPIVTPVRSRSSSDLHTAGGTGSELWRTMVAGGVDLYLAGEVHDTTMVQSDGLTQVTTGGLLYKGEATYLTAEVYADRMELEVHEFHGLRGIPPQLIWQGSRMKTLGSVSYPWPSVVAGRMTLTDTGAATATSGKLADYATS